MRRRIILGLAATLFAWFAMLPNTSFAQPGQSNITSGSYEYVIRIKNGSGEPTYMRVTYWSRYGIDNATFSDTQLVPNGGYFVHTERQGMIGKDPNGRNRIWYISLYEHFQQSRTTRDTSYKNLEWRVSEATKYYSSGNWVTTTTIELDRLRNTSVSASVQNATGRNVSIYDNGQNWTMAPDQTLTWQLNTVTEYTIWFGCKCGRWHPLSISATTMVLKDRPEDSHTGYDYH